jgi:hypothetical protein
MAAIDERQRPCIHVCLLGGADESLYRWVEIGAEEEGVPARQVTVQGGEPVAAAFEAAQSSRFDVGVSIAPGRVTLHERHMPAGQPVLAFEAPSQFQLWCRLMGSNAARMVVRLPLRFTIEEPTPEPPAKPAARASAAHVAAPRPDEAAASDVDVAAIARIVVRILKERGIATP